MDCPSAQNHKREFLVAAVLTDRNRQPHSHLSGYNFVASTDIIMNVVN